MESHPEEDNNCKDEAKCHDALFGFFLRELFYRSSIGSSSLLRTTLCMTEGRTENVIDGDRQDERSASYCKREVVGVVRAIAQRGLCILLNLNGSGRCKQGTDVDGHVENRETRVALVLILRVVVEVAHHDLQVALKQTCTKADEQQSCQHDYQSNGVATQGYREQEIACKHNHNTRSHHATEAELIGHDTTDEREEIN